MRKRKKQSVILIVLIIVIGIFLLWKFIFAGYPRVVFTTGFGKEQVFRIKDMDCTRAEMMVYLTTVQNRYEDVYGSDVWNITSGGETLEENVKETVLARIARVKSMCLLAESKELTLDETESARVKRAAEEYLNSLTDKEKELMGVDEEIINKLYTEYALANKVYQFIIRDINPEVSDDEARTITVQHILIHTWTTDGSGERIDYDRDMKEAMYEKAGMVRELALNGEEDFLNLAAEYSDEDTVTLSFGMGEMPSVFETVAFSLETGEISQVIETREGYHILKCINTFDREQTDKNKINIVEKRKQEVFSDEYNAFVEPLVRQLNTDLWNEIALIHDPEVTTTNFFELYEKYFPI